MLNKINISTDKQKLIIYIVLIVVTLAVFWQVNQYDFINFDDPLYVTQNSHIQSGITLDGFRWAFSTTYANNFWYPMIWLSFMLDYQLFGLNAGGYHLTNLILHVLSTLLLFWLFNRMTGAIWKSAFVAAIFALHPLHVESVAWITERKDVLSAFFWMLTLCLYVYYTEKPVIKRYLLVLCSFVCALMTKPMVVTLPVVMILLDYWPLGRFESKKGKLILWQLREKTPFFLLSAVLVIITLLAHLVHHDPTAKNISLNYRLANAPITFVTYLEKTFWPHNLTVFYPFPEQIPQWQVLGAIVLIIIISASVVVMAKHLPYLFVGWLWYTITIAPIIGIIQSGEQAMADRFTYLPSVGIAVMLAWGIPFLFPSADMRKKIVFPVGIAVLAILAVLTWQQCGYWKNSLDLFNHALQVTKDNYLAHNNRGSAYDQLGQYQYAIEDFNKAIHLKPDYALAYYNRGTVYGELGQYQHAIEDFNKAIHLKQDYADAYNNRGFIYFKFGQNQRAIEDFNKAIRLKQDYADAYYNRGLAYLLQGNNDLGCVDAQKACELGKCKIVEWAKNKGICR